MDSYLILGVDSFIGRHFSKLLHVQRKNLIGTVKNYTTKYPFAISLCDARNDADINNIIKAIKPKYILNCIGLSSPAGCELNPSPVQRINYIFIETLCSAVANYCPQAKLINIGSITELYNLSGKYSLSKIEARKVINSYRYQNYSFTQIYLSNTTGPGQNENFIVPKIFYGLKRIKNKTQNSLELGNINSSIKLVDVQDLCNDFTKIFNTMDNSIEYLVQGEPIVIKDILDRAMEFLGLEYIPNLIKHNDFNPKPLIEYKYPENLHIFHHFTDLNKIFGELDKEMPNQVYN